MKRREILDEAIEAVTVDRAATHGKPEDTFGRIAAVWSARLGVEVTPAQVCILLADLKACRAWGNPAHADNWVDLAGYAACGGELATDRAVEDRQPEASAEPRRAEWYLDPANACKHCGVLPICYHKPDCPDYTPPPVTMAR